MPESCILCKPWGGICSIYNETFIRKYISLQFVRNIHLNVYSVTYTMRKYINLQFVKNIHLNVHSVTYTMRKYISLQFVKNIHLNVYSVTYNEEVH